MAPCWVVSNLPGVERLLCPRPPVFDEDDKYVGPLHLDDDARGTEDPQRLPAALCITILAAGCAAQDTHPPPVPSKGLKAGGGRGEGSRESGTKECVTKRVGPAPEEGGHPQSLHREGWTWR